MKMTPNLAYVGARLSTQSNIGNIFDKFQYIAGGRETLCVAFGTFDQDIRNSLPLLHQPRLTHLIHSA
jgi:hypothetical protein